MSVLFTLRCMKGSWKTTRLIGYRCNCSDAFSRVILITQMLPFFLFVFDAVLHFRSSKLRFTYTHAFTGMRLPSVFFLKIHIMLSRNGADVRYLAKNIQDSRVLKEQMVILARGSHLFPFRTEKLSPSAPMVLPHKGGRVGRCQLT